MTLDIYFRGSAGHIVLVWGTLPPSFDKVGGVFDTNLSSLATMHPYILKVSDFLTIRVEFHVSVMFAPGITVKRLSQSFTFT